MNLHKNLGQKLSNEVCELVGWFLWSQVGYQLSEQICENIYYSLNWQLGDRLCDWLWGHLEQIK